MDLKEFQELRIKLQDKSLNIDSQSLDGIENRIINLNVELDDIYKFEKDNGSLSAHDKERKQKVLGSLEGIKYTLTVITLDR